MYIVIHIQTVLLYNNSTVWLDTPDSRSWNQNPADLNANPRFYHSHEETNASEFEKPCFTLVASITSFARELNLTGAGEHIYIYIYIYMCVCVCVRVRVRVRVRECVCERERERPAAFHSGSCRTKSDRDLGLFVFHISRLLLLWCMY